MDNDDIVQIQDIAAARASVLQTRRKVLATALIHPLILALLAFIAVHSITSLDSVASLVLLAVLVLLGIPVFIHWLRHYESILEQLDALESLVSSGETVYSSQVAFHSYR
ncbi:hypothetical protein D3C81_1783870 [compost metagenome]